MADNPDGRQARLQALRRQIAKAQSFSPRSDQQVPLGIAAVDACLNGGLLRGALHEVAAADHRSIPAALGFQLALTASCGSRGTLLWPLAKAAHPFGLPYPPGLRCFGLDPARLLFVRCVTEEDCLWAMEEGLRLGGVAAVVGARGKRTNLTASRRLQLAAEQAAIPVLLLRSHNDRLQSAAVTRWRVSPEPSARDEFGFFTAARWRVALDYARGGKTGEWVMEWNHDAVSLRLAASMGDRAAGEDRAA
jgi:protein ImuA